MNDIKDNYPKRKLIQDLIIIFIISLIPLLWFKSGYIINGPDVSFPLSPVKFFINRFFTWNHINNTGVESAINITSIFFHAVQAFLFLLTKSIYLTQKISYCFWLMAICTSMYYCISIIQKDRPNRLQRFIGVLVYAFNPFVFNIWEVAKAAEISSLVAIPLLLAFFIQGLDGRLSFLKASLFAGLLSLLFSEIGASPSVIAMPISVCLIYFTFHILREIFRRTNLKRILSLFAFLGLFFGLYILFNAYWILPYGFEILKTLKASDGGGALEAFNMTNWLKGISTHTSVLNVSRFQGAWDWYYSWYDEPYVAYAKNYFNYPFLVIMSVFLPLMAYVAIILKRSKEVVIFTLIALIGSIFATGAHPPFAFIFLWLCQKIPIFLVFRSPYYKFSLATLFAYAYLISVSVPLIYVKMNNSRIFTTVFSIGKRRYKIIPNLIIITFILTYLGYNFPMFTGKIIPIREKLFSLRLKIPDYVFKAADWLNEQEGDFKVVSLPKENLDTYRWGYGAPTNLLNLINNTPVIWGQSAFGGRNKIRDLFYESLYEEKTQNVYKILQLMNVKYIWLRHDAWYDFYGDNLSPSDLREMINNIDGLRLVKRIGQWEFYEVSSPASLINLVEKGSLVFGAKDILATLVDRYNLKDRVLLFYDEIEEEKLNLLFKKKAISQMIFYNYKADSIKEQIKKISEKKDLDFNFIYNTHVLDFEIDKDYKLPAAITLEKIIGFSRPNKHEVKSDWVWLSTNKEPNLIINNSSDKKQLINLIFEVFSYNSQRNLYVYLNDELLQYPSLEPDKPVTIKLRKLKILPGKNVISFYTPHLREIRQGRSVNFAFRNIEIGGLQFNSDFFVPKTAYYTIDIFPYSLETAEKSSIEAQDKKEIIIDGEVHNLLRVEESRFQKQKIILKEGRHTFRIGQFLAEDYYVSFSEIEEEDKVKDEEVTFLKINPTKYQIDLQISKPQYLVFNESYNPYWKLYQKEGSVGIHCRVNGYANAWFIDEIKTDKLFIEYWLQRLFYYGGLISLVSISLAIGSLIWIRRWKR